MNLRFEDHHLSRMRAMREEGISFEKIAQKFGASKTGIMRALRRAKGIPRIQPKSEKITKPKQVGSVPKSSAKDKAAELRAKFMRYRLAGDIARCDGVGS